MKFHKLSDYDLADKRLLIRQDLNVPIKDAVITSDKRIQASLPTIREAISQGAKVLIMSHLGRPVEGEPADEFSLAPVAAYLSAELAMDVPLIKDYLTTPPTVESGQVILLENVRFNVGEAANDEKLAAQYASLCDVFVMDAFGTAHRAQASTHGVGRLAAKACAGPLMSAELEALGNALETPKAPVVAIVGGAKVSSKLAVLESLVTRTQQLIPGGGIANTFIKAAGYSVGKSLVEDDLLELAKSLMQRAADAGSAIPIPEDVIVAKAFDNSETGTVRGIDEVAADEMILDIGPDTAKRFGEMLQAAGTIVWNGPIGVFEFEHFAAGTEAVAKAVANSTAFSIAGGGDTIAAISKFALADDISYISTGGGAFLEFLEGKTLPAVAMLAQRYQPA